MKTKFMLIIAVFAVKFVLAQEESQIPEEKRENIEAAKMGFITREVDLTPEEAQKFWPVFNQYQKEIEMLRKEKRSGKKEIKKRIDELPDVEIEKMVDEEIIIQQRELDIRKKYHGEFKKVLPIRKVAKLYKAERDFRMEILKRIRGEKQMPPKPMPPK